MLTAHTSTGAVCVKLEHTMQVGPMSQVSHCPSVCGHIALMLCPAVCLLLT